MLIVSQKGQVRAHISYDGEEYEIFPLEEGVHAVAKIVPADSANTGVCGIGTLVVPTGDSSPQVPEDGYKRKENTDLKSSRVVACNPAATRVRVLVLSTARARATGLDPTQTAQLAISQFNQAVTNSQVGTDVARLELAGVQNFDFAERQTQPIADIENLRSNPQIQQLRNAARADLVVLLTDGNYIVGNGDLYGIAGNYDANFNLGFFSNLSSAIVEIDQATASYTFAHEVGHLFVARHQSCNVSANGCDQNGTFGHGFSFTRPGALFRKTRRYRTIMQVIRNDYSLIPYFSNPDVVYDTRATGTAAENDNARQLEVGAPIVSRYIAEVQTLTASIDGPTQARLNTTYTWEAVVSCGGAYTYRWETSNDGFTYVPGGTSDRINLSFSVPPPSNYLYLRLTVTSNGQTRTVYRTVYIQGNARIAQTSKDTLEWTEAVELEVPKEVLLEQAYPNPLTKQTQIGFYLPKAQTISLDILNQSGKLIRNVADGSMEAGPYKFTINRGDLPTGLYFYQLSVGDHRYVRRLLIKD